MVRLDACEAISRGIRLSIVAWRLRHNRLHLQDPVYHRLRLFAGRCGGVGLKRQQHF